MSLDSFNVFFNIYGFIIFAIATQVLLWSYCIYLAVKKKSRESRAIKKYALVLLVCCTLLFIADYFSFSWSLDTAWIYALGVVFMLFPVLDWYTTRKALRKGALEANPIMNFIISKIGIDKIIFITAPLVALISMRMILDSKLSLSYIIFAGVYAFVIINNIVVIRNLKDVKN